MISPRSPPIIIRRKSKTDPYKDIITEWLEGDKKHWRKQHYTVKRVYDRHVTEHGFTGSYDLVQKCILNGVSLAMTWIE